jgi:mannose-6-phosphate isomerase
MSYLEPIRLLPRFVERVWGCRQLQPWFALPDELQNSENKIGEVWLSGLENATSTGFSVAELLAKDDGAIFGAGRCEKLPLLVKFLFTSQKLSVQVHPDDDVADRQHGCPGKTECWHVLKAEIPAQVGLGFHRQLTVREARQSAIEGTLDQHLVWNQVQAGDTVFVPAGVVHAIGEGLAICEIQQNSDITYRLYDYGRGRDLHLDQGLAVSQLGPAQAQPGTQHLSEGRDLLVECSKFCLERWRGHINAQLTPSSFYHLWIQTEGSAELGSQKVEAGEVWLLPAPVTEMQVQLCGDALLTYPSWRPTSAFSIS